MKIHCKYDKEVDVSELITHPKNRNTHPPEQIKRLAEILKYQGWRYPVKVSLLSGCITSGHGRLAAAKLNGWKMVPVNFQEYESHEQEYADVQADNAIASWSELDIPTIRADLKEFDTNFDINLLGLENFALEEPNFSPGNEDEQGQLDEKKPTICPACGESFVTP